MAQPAYFRGGRMAAKAMELKKLKKLMQKKGTSIAIKTQRLMEREAAKYLPQEEAWEWLHESVIRGLR